MSAGGEHSVLAQRPPAGSNEPQLEAWLASANAELRAVQAEEGLCWLDREHISQLELAIGAAHSELKAVRLVAQMADLENELVFEVGAEPRSPLSKGELVAELQGRNRELQQTQLQLLQSKRALKEQRNASNVHAVSTKGKQWRTRHQEVAAREAEANSLEMLLSDAEQGLLRSQTEAKELRTQLAKALEESQARNTALQEAQMQLRQRESDSRRDHKEASETKKQLVEQLQARNKALEEAQMKMLHSKSDSRREREETLEASKKELQARNKALQEAQIQLLQRKSDSRQQQADLSRMQEQPGQPNRASEKGRSLSELRREVEAWPVQRLVDQLLELKELLGAAEQGKPGPEGLRCKLEQLQAERVAHQARVQRMDGEIQRLRTEHAVTAEHSLQATVRLAMELEEASHSRGLAVLDRSFAHSSRQQALQAIQSMRIHMMRAGHAKHGAIALRRVVARWAKESYSLAVSEWKRRVESHLTSHLTMKMYNTRSQLTMKAESAGYREQVDALTARCAELSSLLTEAQTENAELKETVGMQTSKPLEIEPDAPVALDQVAKLEGVEKGLNRHKSEATELRARCSQLETKTEQLTTEVSLLTADNSELNAQNVRLQSGQAAGSELEQRCFEYEQELTRLRSELAQHELRVSVDPVKSAHKQSFTESQDEVQRLKVALDETRRQCADATSTAAIAMANSIRTEAGREGELATLVSQLQAAKLESEELRDSRNRCISTQERERRRAEKLQARIEQLNIQNNAMLAELESATEEIAGSGADKVETVQLRTQCVRYQTKLDHMEAEVAMLAAENSKLKADNIRLESADRARSKLELRCSKYEAELEGAIDQATDFKVRCLEYEAEVNLLTDQVSELQAQCSQAEASRLGGVPNVSMEEVQQLIGEGARLQARCEEISQDAEARAAENGRLRERNQELERQARGTSVPSQMMSPFPLETEPSRHRNLQHSGSLMVSPPVARRLERFREEARKVRARSPRRM